MSIKESVAALSAVLEGSNIEATRAAVRSMVGLWRCSCRTASRGGGSELTRRRCTPRLLSHPMVAGAELGFERP